MAENKRQAGLQEGQSRSSPVQHIVGMPSNAQYDSNVAAATQQLNNLQVQGIPVDTYRQRLEGRRVYQHPREMAGSAPQMPYVNFQPQIQQLSQMRQGQQMQRQPQMQQMQQQPKMQQMQQQPQMQQMQQMQQQPQIQQLQQLQQMQQMQQPQQTYYDGLNYVPRMYPEMRNMNVPALTMMYCGVPNPPVNMNDMRYQAPWNQEKFEANVHRMHPDDWANRSDSMNSTDSNKFVAEQATNPNRKPKLDSTVSNIKGSSKAGNRKSATDGMTLLPIVDDLDDEGDRIKFEAALKEALLLEANDGLHKLKVTQESLGSMVDVKELAGSDKSGVALYEKFQSLSEESIVYLSREFSGSKIIQQCLDKYDELFAEMLHDKLKNYQKLLSVDTYGNYVVQHLLQSKSTEIQKDLGMMLEENLLSLSLNFYGCRVVQMAIKYLPAEFCDRCCAKIAPVALHFLQSQHANHVVKAFFSLQGERVPKNMESIHERICKNSANVAVHIYGFKVLQAALGSGLSPELSGATVLSMKKDVITLSCSEYGNYLVQYFIESDIYNSRDMAISCITSAPVLLMTCHKFGSNVIEKAIVHGSHDQKSLIIQRMVQECELSGSTENALLHIASNKFGNYVLQRIFEVSSLQDRELLALHLRPHAKNLGTSVYGKHLIKYL